MNKKYLISNENNSRLDSWLTKMDNGYSRSYFQNLIAGGNILVNGKPVRSNYKIKTGDEICIDLPEPQILDVKPEKIDIDVMYEDSDIIVINKPKGMVVHPAAGNYSGTLVNALMNHCGSSLSDINGIIRPGIVHRIDKDTSGILVAAKNNIAHERLSKSLENHNIKRIYAALVSGVISEEHGKIDAPVGRHSGDRKKMAVNLKNGKRAVTHFTVIERFSNATYIQLELETGRTHQIRVHMSFIGHPVLGDEVYGKKLKDFDTKGQALHAKILGFNHPVTGEYMEFDAGLPEYFLKLLEFYRTKVC